MIQLRHVSGSIPVLCSLSRMIRIIILHVDERKFVEVYFVFSDIKIKLVLNESFAISAIDFM